MDKSIEIPLVGDLVLKVSLGPEDLSYLVWDRESQEAYRGHLYEGPLGSFNAQVKDMVDQVVKDLRFKHYGFSGNWQAQTQRLITWVRTQYHESPENTFKKHPDYLTFRRSDNQKWYGLIMPLSWKKLDPLMSDQKVDVLNLKISPDQRQALAGQDGIYPAYHMSKVHWISVVLDGRLDESLIQELLAASRMLVK